MAEKVQRIKETGKEAAGAAREAAEETVEAAREAAGRSVDAAREAARETLDAAREAGQETKQAASDVAEAAGRAGPYEEWTKDELYERAQELDIEGRSEMNKEELIDALRSNS